MKKKKKRRKFKQKPFTIGDVLRKSSKGDVVGDIFGRKKKVPKRRNRNKPMLLTKKEVNRGRKRYTTRKKKYGLFKDTDRDGTPDYKDGHPKNPKKHSLIGAVATGLITGAASQVVENMTEDKTCPIPTRRKK